MRAAAGGGSRRLQEPGRSGALRVWRAAAAAHCFLRRDSAGDGPDSAGDCASDADGGGGDIGVGVSGGELCALGAAGWRADGVYRAGAAVECTGVHECGGRQGGGSDAGVV